MTARPDYEFVEGATSDLCFVARGATLEEAFAAAAEALLAATLDDPGTVVPMPPPGRGTLWLRMSLDKWP
jgi:hypothetical protein